MGKINGIGGYISGKVGSIVYMKGENGETYGRTYVSKPANPRTSSQLEQRAKMNLVGRISSLVSKNLIAPLGMTGRKNRSLFTKRLLDNATVSIQNGNFLAEVAPESFVYARGAETVKATATAIALTATSVTFDLTIMDASMVGKYGERIVVVVLDAAAKEGVSLVKYIDVLLEDQTPTTVEIPFGVSIQNGSMVCVYRAPFVLSDRAAEVHSEGLYNNNTDFVAAMIATEDGIRGWGQSMLMNKQLFTQA